MSEKIVEPTSNEPAVVEQSEASNETPAEPEAIPPPAAVPKKKGRPAGSKDKAPRKKVQVRIEPIVSQQPEQQTQTAVEEVRQEPPPPPPEPVVEMEEPPSPKSMRIKHTREVLHWRGLELEEHKKKVGEKVFNSLHMMPVI